MSGELALAATCRQKSLNAQTIFKRIALSNSGVALPAHPAYRDSDDAFPLVVFLYPKAITDARQYTATLSATPRSSAC